MTWYKYILVIPIVDVVLVSIQLLTFGIVDLESMNEGSQNVKTSRSLKVIAQYSFYRSNSVTYCNISTAEMRHHNVTSLLANNSRIMRLGIIIIVFSSTTQSSWAFMARLSSRTVSTSALFSLDDFDDLPSIGDAVSADGEALAKAFYQQVRQRQETEEENEQDPARRLSSREYGKDVPQSPVRKFTGQQQQQRIEDTQQSAGLFSGRGVSVYSIPKNSPRQRMLDNEFNLVGRSERSLLIQIVATLTLLTFAVYIGMTGGISDNDWSSVPDSIDTSMEGTIGVMPVPTDTEISVWL